MTGAKVCLAGASGLAIIDATTLEGFEKMGTIGLLVGALIVVWKAGAKREALVYDMHRKTIEAIERSSLAILQVTEAIKNCPGGKTQ